MPSREDRADFELAMVLGESVRAADKTRAPMCIDAVCTGLAVLKSGDSFPAVFRSRYPTLLDSALAFISTPLTDAQLDDMERTWSVCRCDMATVAGGMHPTTGSLSKDRNLSRIIVSLIALVVAALHQVSPAKLAQKAAHGKWPPSIAHLLPAGPKALVQAMLQWLRYTVRTNQTQTYPFCYVGLVLQFCPSAQRDVADSAELLSYFSKRLRAVIAALESNTRADLPIFPKPHEAIEHLLIFYQELTHFIPEREMTVYLAPQARALYTAATRFLSVLPTLHQLDDDREQFQKAFQKMERVFWLALPDEVRPDRAFPAFEGDFMAMFEEHTLLFAALRAYEHANACCGPSCFRTGEYAAEPLRRCQRCGMMLYCSRECQKEHWKWPTAPHKGTCENIGQFWAVYKSATEQTTSGGPDERELFRRAVNTKGLSWNVGYGVMLALDALDNQRQERQQSKAVVLRS